MQCKIYAYITVNYDWKYIYINIELHKLLIYKIDLLIILLMYETISNSLIKGFNILPAT